MSAAATTIGIAGVKPTSLKRNFAWTSAGNAVYAACQWGMVSVLAHAGGAEMVGRYALGVAITAPVLMLAQLNLRSVLATDPHAEANFADYRDLRFFAMALGAAVIAVMAFTGQAPAGVVLAAGAMQSVEWISDIYLGLMQRRENMRRMAISVALRGLASIAALAAGVVLTGSLVIALAAVAIARLAILLAYDRKLMTQVRRANDTRPARMASIARVAAPLGVVLMMGSVAANMPRYWTAYHLNEAAVGVFAALASLGTAANLVVNALGQAATPKLAKLHAEGDLRGFASVALKMIGGGVVLGLAGVAGSLLLGRWVLGLAYGAEFAAHTGLLAATMAACGIGYVASLLGYVLTAARKFTAQVPLQAATIAATAAGCALLIPAWGLIGAAAGVGVGYLVQTLGEAWVLRGVMTEAAR